MIVDIALGIVLAVIVLCFWPFILLAGIALLALISLLAVAIWIYSVAGSGAAVMFVIAMIALGWLQGLESRT